MAAKGHTRCSAVGVWPDGPDLMDNVRRETEEMKGTEGQLLLSLCPFATHRSEAHLLLMIRVSSASDSRYYYHVNTFASPSGYYRSVLYPHYSSSTKLCAISSVHSVVGRIAYLIIPCPASGPPDALSAVTCVKSIWEYSESCGPVPSGSS
jgi:hypothetical protein